jgi:hypothetical protein
MTTRLKEQEELCRERGVSSDPCRDDEKVGIAIATLHLLPLNGLRHPREGDTCGWYIWGGEELSDHAEFFQPLHVSHLPNVCPRAIRYLALPAGWRFLDAPGHEDVWYDPALLNPAR